MFLHVCSECRSARNYPDALAGRRVACERCRQIIALPTRTAIAAETLDGLGYRRQPLEAARSEPPALAGRVTRQALHSPR